ncbi:non-homologous end-joining DNA ligase [Calidifontibacillus oryziterrae]|uniref:non-homologous end-joining DNA ligase n=1 Tax=Calidifontibacillus oryziterrae TaxID=1191699 RepID=UPI0002D40227|nr:non-homologous end-joining DNA ligase [Calidifontibacillus oryziterrae]
MGRGYDEGNEVVINNMKVKLTNVTKILWSKKNIRKIDYLHYLIKVSYYILPFLQDRLLTTIRYPDGVHNEKFYQKNCPDYAPEYIKTKKEDGITYINCRDQETLLWLGNQSAIEFHVPFSTIDANMPTEIVLDLDPPSRQEFSLAVEASLIIKEVLDQLKLLSFIKTSGNKGLQIYIPLPDKTYSYKDTRLFTAFIANYLINKEPNWFTTERLKVKRGKKLYVDYVQHAEGKTIIAPYSLRGNEDALVATPLQWKEVNHDLRPEQFPFETIEQRLIRNGCPFNDKFFKVKSSQPFGTVLELLRKNEIR